jgi:hypothetical protein
MISKNQNITATIAGDNLLKSELSVRWMLDRANFEFRVNGGARQNDKPQQ